MPVTRGERARRLQKAFLRYHDPDNWPMLREALKAMGRADLIGTGKHQLIPAFQPGGGAPGRRPVVPRSARMSPPRKRARNP